MCWWAMFQADRLSSLMLGTPYSIPDTHCNMSFKGKELPLDMTGFGLITRLALLAGKVIDRTHALNGSTYESALEIDREISQLGTNMPQEYWKTEQFAPRDMERANKWMETLLSQSVFYQMRLILHMPYMLRSATKPGYEFSTNACFEAARNIIRLFQALRAPENAFVYKCIACDFVGFLGCITLVLGLMGYGHNDSTRNQKDWDLIESTMALFEKVSAKPFGRIASQSFKALQQLIQYRHPTTEPGQEEIKKIVIPFFGTITILCGKSLGDRVYRSAAPPVPSPAYQNSLRRGIPMEAGQSAYMASETHIAYEGPYMQPSFNGFGQNMPAFAEQNQLPWGMTGNPAMDLDQVC
jgi:hypothetical protein